jgi:hypothetical protein
MGHPDCDLRQSSRAPEGARGLNLVVATITLWNTVYLENAVEALRQHSTVDDGLLRHVSRLDCEHINLTGDYVRQTNQRVAKERF